MLYKSLAPLPPEVLARIVADKRFRREHIESLDLPGLAEAMLGSRAPGNVRFHATAGRGDTIAGHAPVAGHDWVVAVSEPSAYFAEPLNEVFRRAMLSVGAVGLFFCIVAVLISRSFLRPIRALTSAADALRRGDFEGAHVPVTRRDEVGHLARTFNVMIDVLRQRERERGEQRGSAVHER
jgi:HAMP domain-containing protein